MKAVCIFLAEGFEEMEAMFPLDIMRRGGLNVKNGVCHWKQDGHQFSSGTHCG